MKKMNQKKVNFENQSNCQYFKLKITYYNLRSASKIIKKF